MAILGSMTSRWLVQHAVAHPHHAPLHPLTQEWTVSRTNGARYLPNRSHEVLMEWQENDTAWIYIYIYTHIHLCVYYLYVILYYIIYTCVCVFLNPFEPNKQTYIKLHKLGQNHGWDQDRPRTPPGALGLSCGRGSVAVAQACLLFPHAVDLLLVDGHGPWLYGGFHKWGYPQIDGLKWKIQLKWMIWGYHYIRKPLYVYIYNYIYINYKL